MRISKKEFKKLRERVFLLECENELLKRNLFLTKIDITKSLVHSANSAGPVVGHLQTNFAKIDESLKLEAIYQNLYLYLQKKYRKKLIFNQ